MFIANKFGYKFNSLGHMEPNGYYCVKLEICTFPPSPSPAQLVNLTLLQARAKLSLEIQNSFKPQPSQAGPTQTFLLKPARYTLPS